jgi:rhodanese-related sulfurtransferase
MKKFIKKINPYNNSLLKSFLMGVLGAILVLAVNSYFENKPENRIYNFFHDEMAATVSPNTLKRWIDANDTSYILVDLRSAPEYQKEHLKTAINVPAGTLKPEEIVSEFRKLDQSKVIVVYCYSHSCTLGSTVGRLLSENGIYVKELRVGWSELKYFWSLWNPGAKDTDNKNYIEGNPNSSPLPVPCAEGEFGC